MTYVQISDSSNHPVPFYLSVEEVLARRAMTDDYLMMWQVDPSVIFGRNQLMHTEVDIDYCRQHSISTFRRKSGGGCVYADRGNIMLSLITKADSVAMSYHRYTTMVVWALQQIGISASANGRNDILVDGRKVAGNAFYHLGQCNIVHGTLLYDTTMEHMTNALTPPREKLRSKGVESVRQHVALLKDFTSLSIGQVKESVRQQLCANTYVLTADDKAQATAIMQEYLSPEFIVGNNPAYTLRRSGRIPDVGNFDISITAKNNIIKAITISGDFFATGNLQTGISDKLVGVALERESLLSHLPDDLGDTVMNLRSEALADLLTNP